MTSHLLKTLREVLMDAVHVSFDFFKVLIPISIAMKILAELDWIRYLALPLEPVMQLTGLPADLGIAWATGIMVNFYSALIVFIGLLPGLPPLTTEQVTTLAVMMLICRQGWLWRIGLRTTRTNSRAALNSFSSRLKKVCAVLLLWQPQALLMMQISSSVLTLP